MHAYKWEKQGAFPATSLKIRSQAKNGLEKKARFNGCWVFLLPHNACAYRAGNIAALRLLLYLKDIVNVLFK